MLCFMKSQAILGISNLEKGNGAGKIFTLLPTWKNDRRRPEKGPAAPDPMRPLHFAFRHMETPSMEKLVD